MLLHPFYDGKTHINISLLTAHTRLGSLLSNLAPIGFNLNATHYSSIEGYWYELSISKDCPSAEIEYLRTLSGTYSKYIGRKLQSKYGSLITHNFEYLIAEALLLKVMQNRELRRLLKHSELPITHYLWYGTKGCPEVHNLNRHYWICVEYENIRERLQKGEL